MGQIDGNISEQGPGPGPGSESFSDSLEQSKEIPEASFKDLELEEYYLDNIHQSYTYRDSFLNYRFLQYNPVYEQEMPQLFLGNNGSASTPITQIFKRKSGFDLGFHAYDIYSMSLDSFKWFHSNFPYTDLFFSNGPESVDFRVAAKFAVDLSSQWSLNVDYERIMETGYYDEQATKQSSLALGMKYYSPKTKSNTFFNFITNIHQEENNGGLSDTTYFSNPNNSIRIIIPVVLDDAVGRLQNSQFSMINYFPLFQKPDSLSSDRDLQLDLISTLAYESGFFKYYDTGSTSDDSLYYQELLVDDLGIRHYLSYDKISISPAIQAYSFTKNRLKVGAQYDWWFLEQEPLDRQNIHDLKLFGKLDFSIREWVAINAKAQYHLGSYTGDYDLFTSGRIKIKDFLSVEASQELQSSHPSIIEQNLFISTQRVSENAFEPVFRNQSQVGIGIPRFGFYASLTYDRIHRHIYYDPVDLFQQMDQPLQIIDFKLQEQLSLFPFHLDLEGHLLSDDSDLLNIPDFYVHSRLYYKGFILNKRLFLNAGIELRFMDGFYIPAYQATVGRFYTQNEFESDAFPVLNFYLSFKVGNFRFFARTENILQAITGQVHYYSYLYPQNDFKSFRMGVRWQFLD